VCKSEMTHAYIASYVRTPFHFATKGALAGVRPDDLCAHAISALINRTGIDPSVIEDVIVGCSYPEAEQGMNVARIASFIAGLPITVSGATVNRFCGSSMSAIHFAAGAIAIGAGKAFICAGVESMSRVPQGGFNRSPNSALEGRYPEAYTRMGNTAENVAKQWKISRERQEAFAVQSHAKAAAASSSGKLAPEIVAVETATGEISTDGCIRPGTTADVLSKLKPAFGEAGTVTAGTSSPLTDGSAAVLVCDEATLRKFSLTPLARIHTVATAGCAPELMGIGPVPASKKALERAKLSIKDIDLIELNEAFASQALACVGDIGIDESLVNLHGGALALGHPLGATGARITGKAAALLLQTGGRYALATQCIGGGQGIATILERA
jgi:acetyl-CoA acyltransferase